MAREKLEKDLRSTRAQLKATVCSSDLNSEGNSVGTPESNSQVAVNHELDVRTADMRVASCFRISTPRKERSYLQQAVLLKSLYSGATSGG